MVQPSCIKAMETKVLVTATGKTATGASLNQILRTNELVIK